MRSEFYWGNSNFFVTAIEIRNGKLFRKVDTNNFLLTGTQNFVPAEYELKFLCVSFYMSIFSWILRL